MGVVAAIAPENPSLLGLIESIAPIITSGNTVIILASTKAPLSAMSFAEVLATSDLPAGVVNILTGKKDEIAPWMASHMDIDGMDLSGLPAKLISEVKVAGAENLKRIHSFKGTTPARITAFTESKTIWHTIGV
jgi:acyl-CoA reductase-like NAD-dependent aldehyde dehydrogenase